MAAFVAVLILPRLYAWERVLCCADALMPMAWQPPEKLGSIAPSRSCASIWKELYGCLVAHRSPNWIALTSTYPGVGKQTDRILKSRSIAFRGLDLCRQSICSPGGGKCSGLRSTILSAIGGFPLWWRRFPSLFFSVCSLVSK